MRAVIKLNLLASSLTHFTFPLDFIQAQIDFEGLCILNLFMYKNDHECGAEFTRNILFLFTNQQFVLRLV